MIKEICMGLAMLLALTGCNDSKKVNLVEQKEAYWKTNSFCLYNEQNPSMRLKLDIPVGLYPPDNKLAHGCSEENGISMWRQPEELEAFVAKNTDELVRIDRLRKNAKGDQTKYDDVAHEIEIQITMKSNPIDLIYIEKRLKEKKMNNEFIFDKNWLVAISPSEMIDVPNKMTSTVTLSHKNGLRVFMFSYDKLDGEKISPKRDQIIRNVILMVNSFNPDLSKQN